MAVYADVYDVQRRMQRDLTADEKSVIESQLEGIGVLLDAVAPNATNDAKKEVSIRMAVRIIGDGDTASVPIGATQGSMSGLGYSQSWTIGSGAAGDAYLSKTDRLLLGLSNQIGTHSPVEDIGGGVIL